MAVGSEASKQVYVEDETRQWKFVKGVFSQLRKDCPVFGILVIGETGTGKSTLINNLLGKEVAPVGHTMESETLKVTPHEVTVEGVPVVVYDTPGLDDTREGEDEEKYLDIMKSLLARKKIHLVIYCLKMTETRMRKGLIRTFEEYHKIGVPWEQTVITVTFADMYKEGDPSRFSQIQQQLKKTLVGKVRVAQSIVEKLKIRPTAKDPKEALPSGRPWYVPFWLDVVEVLVPAALVRFFDIHEGNIHLESMPTSSQSKSVNVTLAGEDKERYERQISRLSEVILYPTTESSVGANSMSQLAMADDSKYISIAQPLSLGPTHTDTAPPSGLSSLTAADHPDHLILFRTYVSRTAISNGRAVLEGVGLDSATITACFTSHPQNEEEAVQAGLTKWKDGKGRQPPMWTVLLKAMTFARIAQQHVIGLKKELGQIDKKEAKSEVAQSDSSKDLPSPKEKKIGPTLPPPTVAGTEEQGPEDTRDMTIQEKKEDVVTWLPPESTLPTPVHEENSILFSCQPKDMTVLMKQSFTVHCRAETGSENLWYQLFERKVNGECSPVTNASSKGEFDVNSGILSGPNQEVVLFVRAFKESDSQPHSSVYRDSTHFKVQFREAMFVAQPLQNMRATAGKYAMLMCRLVSSDEHPPEVTYQWYRGERRNSNDFKLIRDEKSNILRLSNLSPNDTGYYGCRVCVIGDRSDIYYSEETHLTVGKEEEGDIVITEHPLPKVVEVKRGGDYKFFTCAMSRIGEPLQFVWLKDGRQCRTEGPILEIKSATVANSGTYTCVVTAVNSGRKKETAAVNLTVPRPVDLTKVTPHMKAEAYVKGKLRGKVALLIANQDYSHYQKLQMAEEDVKKLARELRILGFNVLTLANLTSREMQEAEAVFCHHLLSKDATGVLAFVYFAGHGFLDPQDSAEYLMPVDAANLTPNNNINRESFCLSSRLMPQCAKLLRITDCCRTVDSSEDVQQRPVRPPSSLLLQEDFYNFLDVKGCGYFRTASEVFLAKILQELMAKRHLTLHELIQGIQEKARQYDQKTGHQRPQVTAHNMAGMEQMKLSDEIDRAAYAHLADPAPDQECVERWTKLDPSGLPKNLVLGNKLREKVEVKLTIEEIFSNVLRVTVCAERQEDTGADSLSVSIDVASLRESEIEVRDEEGCKTGTKHIIVLRSIQRLKNPLTLRIDVCMNDEHGRWQKEKLTYTDLGAPLYSALKPS